MSILKHIILPIALMTASVAQSQAQNKLTVTITNIEMKGNSAVGIVYVCLYPPSAGSSSKFPSCEPSDVPGVRKEKLGGINGGSGSIEFANLPGGKYALSAFQDSNPTDGKLNTEPKLWLLGTEVPVERVGTFKKTCSAPVFKDMAFTVPSPSKVSIKLEELGIKWKMTCKAD